MTISRRSFIAAASASLLAQSSGLANGEDAGKKDVDDPKSFSHHTEKINGIKMHYVEEGKGPLVILLHGFPFLWYLWRNQIHALADAGYRVVAPDQRGYGQTDCPDDVNAYDITQLVGDVVGLVQALGEKTAVLVGQDWGSPVAYNAALMRPDLFRGVFMMCAPPAARGAVRPSDAARAVFKDLTFYVTYISRPQGAREIMGDLRDFLLGIYYSTSGSCPDAEQWRWVWGKDKEFRDTYTVPKELPPFLSRQALDYYVAEFTRTGIQPSINWYLAMDRSWEVTSFLTGAVVRQPALFLTGDRDPSIKPQLGIDRQGPALKALKDNFVDLRKNLTIKGAGHTPPEEKPREVNELLLAFLGGLK